MTELKQPQYLTVTETADLLGVSRSRVHQLVREKCPQCDGDGCERCLGTGRRIPATKLGRQWVIPADWDFGLLEHRYTQEPLVDEDADEAEWLRVSYVEDGCTIEEIADVAGVAPMTVWRRLKQYGIETRDRGPQVTVEKQPVDATSAGEEPQRERELEPEPEPEPEYRDGDWLRCMYEEKGMEVDEIAEQAGVSANTIYRYMRQNDIALRPDIDEIWLRQKYVGAKMSSYDIGELKGCSHQTILNYLRKYGIPVRPYHRKGSKRDLA